ncbi:tannase/feruloyl esterase family alpha/beta hydrolase [Pantoea sp. LMR881]
MPHHQKPAAFAYFNGCSDGGREALMEAAAFPAGFQTGIIA